jgi:hypothetical protein
MKAALLSRLERLEAKTVRSGPLVLRCGWLKRLPKDFVGARHVVTVKREPAGSPNAEWCQFEERPGPAPAGLKEPGCVIYLTPDEMKI